VDSRGLKNQAKLKPGSKDIHVKFVASHLFGGIKALKIISN
jgi:hypothetical protein